MTESDYKEILYKLRPTNRDLWSGSIYVALFGVILVLSLFEIFGTRSETIAILSGLFTASGFGRLSETLRIRKKIDNALKGKMVTKPFSS